MSLELVPSVAHLQESMFFTNNHVIGGTAAGARNVISGNTTGIVIAGFTAGPAGNVVQGNFIGLERCWNGPLPNTHGIAIFDAANNTIGGTQSEAANKIAFNGGAGVSITVGTGNVVRGNSIFSNAGLGIDLGTTNGVTPNDGNDGDTGATSCRTSRS